MSVMRGQSKDQRRTAALSLVSQASALVEHDAMRELLEGYVVECRRTRNSQGDALLARRIRTITLSYADRDWNRLKQPALFALLMGEAIGLLA